MIENTINADVTMVDPSLAGGTGRYRAGDEILGRYVVESELGQGGMGVVYLCHDRIGGVKVAVKGLPPEISHNSDEMEAVRDNFQLVSELRHPNIAGVRTLEKVAATGDYFLVMAYARGVSLKRWLRDHRGREYRAEHLKVLRQIASALDYAHNAEPRHIIHRDIKPENVMVDAHENVMVLDFGLAAQVRSSMSRVSQAVTSRSGTPAYKSPEQWLAQAQRAPSDQYSLGVIAYQMFSGGLPFDSDDIEILKHAVSFDRVPKIPGESRALNAVFAKVLAKKPEDRFASCSEFVDALEMGGVGTGSSGRGALVVVVGSLIAFIVLCGWWVWKSQGDIGAELQAEAAHRQERLQRLAEKERLAMEARREAEARVVAAKAESERIAAEKAEAELVAAAKRKAEEEARKAAEKIEAERKAKAESERIAAEKAVAETAGKHGREATQKAIALFKKGDWQAGLLQAEKADQDDAELLFWLGTCHDMGLGDGCDAQKAVEYFRRAAEKGQIDALCELGRRYESGRGVDVDLSQAKRWYQTAASQGSKTAELGLRRLYGRENAASREKPSVHIQKNQMSAERRSARESEELQKNGEVHADLVADLKAERARNGEVHADLVVDLKAERARNDAEERPVSLSGRTNPRFTREDASTLELLKFSSSIADLMYVSK